MANDGEKRESDINRLFLKTIFWFLSFPRHANISWEDIGNHKSYLKHRAPQEIFGCQFGQINLKGYWLTFWEWFHGTYLYYAFRRWLNIPIIIWEYDEPIHAYRAWFLAQRLNSGDVSPYVSNSSLRENISIGELESQGGFPYMNKNVIIHPWYIFIYYIH